MTAALWSEQLRKVMSCKACQKYRDLNNVMPEIYSVPLKGLSYPLLSLFGVNSSSAFDPGAADPSGSPGAVGRRRAAPGAGGGYRRLAQGHLIRGWGRRRVLHNYSLCPYFCLWVGIRTSHPPTPTHYSTTVRAVRAWGGYRRECHVLDMLFRLNIFFSSVLQENIWMPMVEQQRHNNPLHLWWPSTLFLLLF